MSLHCPNSSLQKLEPHQLHTCIPVDQPHRLSILSLSLKLSYICIVLLLLAQGMKSYGYHAQYAVALSKR